MAGTPAQSADRKRQTKRAQIGLRAACLRYSQASVEEVNYRAERPPTSPLSAARDMPLGR